VPANDIWIAAVAASVGVPVLTYDPHFSFMERVSSLVLPSP
jgi:predicted nucleic acid-binding protein